MAKTFLLEIVTPEQILLSKQVESVIVPAAEGYLGILAGHAPLLATLQPGEVKLRDDHGTTSYLFTSGGFLEVTPQKVNLLTEASEPAEKIDVKRAEEARERAKQRLATAEPGIDKARARTALARAEARLKAAKRKS